MNRSPRARVRLLWEGGAFEDRFVPEFEEELTVEDRRKNGAPVTFQMSGEIDFDGTHVFRPTRR